MNKNQIMTETFDDVNFNEDSELSSQTVDWGKIGDSIVGTFVKSRHGIETQFGTNSIYEILAEKGQFHKLTKKVPADSPTVINKGETWAVWGRGDIFVGQLNSIRPGQVIKLMFTEERETPMGVAKIVKIYAPRTNEGKPLMNQQWLDEQGLMAGEM